MKPRYSILDRSFHYTPAAQTDLRKTFARVRREQNRKPAAPATKPDAFKFTLVPVVRK